MAGGLGVTLKTGLLALGVVTQALAVTDEGLVWLKELGFAEPSERPTSRACLDWTERVPHLAGAAGAHLCQTFFDQGWLRRIGTTRAVVLTPNGEENWRELGLT